MVKTKKKAERAYQDHVCHATAKFAGVHPQVDVKFRNVDEVNKLIRLLEDLRDNPKLQRYHIHLQDHSMRSEYLDSKPEDVRIIFNSPRAKRSPLEREILEEGKLAMRALPKAIPVERITRMRKTVIRQMLKKRLRAT